MRRKAIIAICITVAAAFLGLYLDFRVTDTRSLMAAAKAQQVEPYAFYVRMEKSVDARYAVPTLTAAHRAEESLPDGAVMVLENAKDTRIALTSACAPKLTTLQTVIYRMRNALGNQKAQVCLTGRTQRRDIEQAARDLLSALGDEPRESLIQDSLVSITGDTVQVALRRDAQGARVYIGRPHIPIEY
ncbi:hypothetical protein [Beduinella massiliensis]|uniref:hypothetical protein n=1 Tax=Beduinella massiliensis TaxID=1852363 RepID=UPI000C8479A1